MSEALRAGVVGVGYLGAFHASKYAEAAGVELAAVYDSDAARADEIARRNGCRAAGSLEDLLSSVDVASIAASTAAHHELASAALSAGVHVLVEKPLAATAGEGRRLVELAERCGRVLHVGHLERFNPAFADLARVLTKPRFIECHRLSPFAGRGVDTDVVFDVMIHDLDLIAFLVGRPLAAVEAVGVPVLSDHADIANARLRFEGGCIANVTASRVSLKRERRLRIFQEDAYVAVDFEARSIRVIRRRESAEEASAESPMAAIDVSERSFEEADPLRAEIDAFLAEVRGERTRAVGGRDALVALEMAERIRAAVDEETARAPG